MRFNDDVYFYMSKGLIDPDILEIISNNQVINSILLAPGTLIKQIWESNEFKTLYSEIFSNMHEDSEKEQKYLVDTENKLTHFYNLFNFKKHKHYHMKWNLSQKEIENELERQ